VSVNCDIAVVHLVRAGNSPEALGRFLESYHQHPAGIVHRLIILLKGFANSPPPHISDLLSTVSHAQIACADEGYDVASYFFAAERIGEPLVFFANSFSVIRGDQWLSKLLNAYQRERVGLVGATGSWESMTLDAPSHGILRTMASLALTPPLRLLFPAFPNPHVRTNGFLLARQDFLAMRTSLMSVKLGAWMFESGRNSMTRQILRRGLDALVVGRNGTAYRPEEWSRSQTFWQSAQENLLIGDNRTAAYEHGGDDFKARKFRSAWNL
jgi:hypothetical protein